MSKATQQLHPAVSERLAYTVRSARKDARMTQAQLADACGLERTSITNIEAGRQTPPLATLYRMADALKLRPEDLLSGPRLCCGDWQSCRQPCVPRADHWQAEAHRMIDRVHELQGAIAQRALQDLRDDEAKRRAHCAPSHKITA